MNAAPTSTVRDTPARNVPGSEKIRVEKELLDYVRELRKFPNHRLAERQSSLLAGVRNQGTRSKFQSRGTVAVANVTRFGDRSTSLTHSASIVQCH